MILPLFRQCETCLYLNNPPLKQRTMVQPPLQRKLLRVFSLILVPPFAFQQNPLPNQPVRKTFDTRSFPSCAAVQQRNTPPDHLNARRTFDTRNLRLRSINGCSNTRPSWNHWLWFHLLGIGDLTYLHISMILSTLGLNPHGFAFGHHQVKLTIGCLDANLFPRVGNRGTNISPH